jgi:hypothetical protein
LTQKSQEVGATLLRWHHIGGRRRSDCAGHEGLDLADERLNS